MKRRGRRVVEWFKRVVFRSAVTGKFVSESFYLKNPMTTIRDTFKIFRRKSK